MALMVSSGLILGTVLDIYRVLKHRLRLRGWVISLIDFLYWAVAAGLVFSLLMWSNWGELRFFIFVAVLAGFSIYYTWFSRGMIRWIKRTIQIIERIILALARIFHVLIWTPLFYLWTLLLSLLYLLGRVLKWLVSPFYWLIKSWTKGLFRVWRWPVHFWHRIRGRSNKE